MLRSEDIGRMQSLCAKASECAKNGRHDSPRDVGKLNDCTSVPVPTDSGLRHPQSVWIDLTDAIKGAVDT